jgi:hypothetical protein
MQRFEGTVHSLILGAGFFIGSYALSCLDLYLLEDGLANKMRRKLLVLALGISFLIGVSWVGGILSNAAPHTPTAHVQTTWVGPYQVTIQVDPNPPLLTQPATISVQIANASQQAVTDARVYLDSTMETMDMGTARDEAHAQGNGVYRGSVQFSMSGPWRLQVLIERGGQKAVEAAFEVTAQ